MHMKDIKSSAIKKALIAQRVYFRWHNKNKNGGNFGINVINSYGNDFEFTGQYTENELIWLRFGQLFGRDFFVCNVDMLNSLGTFDEVLNRIVRLLTKIEKVEISH